MNDEVSLEFGKGKIGGYVSAVLGILALCGVLCFRFPAQLTSEEFRSAYSVDFARHLLLATLIVAYFTGIVSYVLSSSKVLAWIGVGSSFAATLLGGSRIEVQPFESTQYSLGLDWFAISLIFSMLIFIPIERAFALHREQKILRPGWRTDVCYFFVSHLAIQFIFLFINAFSSIGFSWAAYAPLQSSVQAWPVWVQFLLATFFADLSQYATHRLHHKIPFLWRFHSIHHGSETMDWLAGSRTHLIEIFVTRALVMVPLYILGFSQRALDAYVVLVGVQAVAIHANLGINFGPLRWILVTPQYHHWHHAKDEDYVDANYAVHLPIIDMIFGTYRCPKGEWPAEYGVISDPPPETFWKQLKHPLQSAESERDDA